MENIKIEEIKPEELTIENVEKLKGNLKMADNVAISAAVVAGITFIYFLSPYLREPMSSPYGINAINVLKDCHSIKDVLQQAPLYGLLIPEGLMIGLPLGVRKTLKEKLSTIKGMLKLDSMENDLEPDNSMEDLETDR